MPRPLSLLGGTASLPEVSSAWVGEPPALPDAPLIDCPDCEDGWVLLLLCCNPKRQPLVRCCMQPDAEDAWCERCGGLGVLEVGS